MADLGVIDGDVPFDAATADTLIAGCRAAATAVEGQAGGRAAAVTTASTDFAGHFSQVFAVNARTAAADATELVLRLRQVADGAEVLKASAAAEQKRREVARAWQKKQDDRSWLEKGKDGLFGGDDPPVGPPDPEPHQPVDAAPNRVRQTPPPGGGAGAGAPRPRPVRRTCGPSPPPRRPTTTRCGRPRAP